MYNTHFVYNRLTIFSDEVLTLVKLCRLSFAHQSCKCYLCSEIRFERKQRPRSVSFAYFTPRLLIDSSFQTDG